MKYLISVLAIICSLLLVFACGCADVSVTKKVGDFGTAFGTSSDEQKAIDWFKTTYGDPTTNNDQPARFLEPLITTGLSTNNMPVDKVITFPVSGGSIYFFVIYDNFKKGAPITVSWVYMENGREVTRVEKQAGGDFGRFIVEFQRPDSGWGKGKQRITITGDDAAGQVDFSIGDALQTTPLPYNPTGTEGTIAKTGGLRTGSDVATIIPTDAIEGVTPVQPAMTGSSGGVTLVGTLPTTSTLSVDTKTDVRNCGKIGNVCPDVLNARKRCNVGYCLYVCLNGWDYNSGHVDAPIDPKVGCTLNTNIDPKNCGAFDVACKSSEVCQDGECVSTCTQKADANIKSCNSGCADLKTDVDNCGYCGHSCTQLAPPHAFVQCINSQCVPSSFTNGGTCQPGWADCDGRFLSTGCEKDVSTDNQNCGGCDKACPGIMKCVSAGMCCDKLTGTICCDQGSQCDIIALGLVPHP